MYKFGLKLWSINENYLTEAIRLYEEEVYSYIELYVVPESYPKFSDMWAGLQQKHNIPFVIHAPHFGHDLNLAKISSYERNMKLYQETKRFADLLSVDYIIFHPGVDGDITETVRQLNQIGDKRIIIENKPYYAMDSKLVCNCNSPEDMSFLIQETGLGFCLDVGHAFCSAKAREVDELIFLKEFMSLQPKLFHLSDGLIDSVFDEHLNIGKGNYPLKDILKTIGANKQITIETNKNSQTNLEDFKQDVKNLINITKIDVIILPIDKSDMMNIFELANDQAVRSLSFDSNKITLEIHEKWFNAKLQDENNYFYKVIEGDNNFVGYVRYDFLQENEYVVSVAMKENYRGQGLCPRILIDSADLLKTTQDIVAYIKHNNQISLKCFYKAGYVVVDEQYDYQGYACYKLTLQKGKS